jgi:hypothetical protein
MNYNQQPPRLISYWLGYRSNYSKDNNNYLTPTLEQLPNYADVVILAFALVRPQNVIDPIFMCNPPNNETSIVTGIRTLQRRGQKVLLSVGGWGGNCWDSVTSLPALASSIMSLVTRWGLDGVDLDYEGDNPLDDWMKTPACPGSGSQFALTPLINVLRPMLGAQRILTVVTTGQDFSADGTIEQLNWVSTMDYGGTGAYDWMVSQYQQKYPRAKILPFSLGVTCTGGSDLDTVKQLCQYKPPIGPLRMMFWDLSEDNPGFTNYPPFTYANTINANLPGQAEGDLQEAV